MHSSSMTTTTIEPRHNCDDAVTGEKLQGWIDHATHLLPTQGPIQVFVHHNTLHAFERLPFHLGVLQGLETFGCEPYLSEDRFRREMANGRITAVDLEFAMHAEMGSEQEQSLGAFGTISSLRYAMLRYPIYALPYRELQWSLAEGNCLRTFAPGADPESARSYVAQVRASILEVCANSESLNKVMKQDLLSWSGYSDLLKIHSWSERTWVSVALQALWKACKQGVAKASRSVVFHKTNKKIM
jgi:uncharacterized protein